MKKLLSIVSVFCLLLASCAKEQATTTQDDSSKTGTETGAVTHISCRNAKLSGKINVPGTTSKDLSYGVLYSTSTELLVGTAVQTAAKSFDPDYNFFINTEALEPETTYYYRSYITQGKETVYGEIKSFKTLAVSSMIQTTDAADIHPKDAILNAMLDLTDCNYGSVEYGFEVTPEGGLPHTVQSSNHSDKKFSVKDETLARDTQYSFVAYVKLDGRTYKAEPKTFTTISIQASVTAETLKALCTTATVSGKLAITSEGTFTTSAELYHSSTATTLEELKSSGTKQTITLKADGTYSIVASGLAYNAKSYYCVVAKVEDAEFASSVNTLTTKTLPAGAVDMGLSVLWHQCNLGASKPEEYGRYFAYGDVEGQTWDGEKWSGDGFYSSLEYELDDKKKLKPEYDAAHVLLGGSWRMPTKLELKELADNCTFTWTDNYNSTGIAGMTVVGKTPGYTDKSIFLPAPGFGIDNNIDYINTMAFYRSGSYYIEDWAWVLSIPDEEIRPSVSMFSYGYSIRPVSE